MGKRYMSMRAIASHARRREGLGPTFRSAFRAWTQGVGMFLVLFAATSVYITLRGGRDVESMVESFAAAWRTLPTDAQPQSIPAMALGLREADVKEVANE